MQDIERGIYNDGQWSFRLFVMISSRYHGMKTSEAVSYPVEFAGVKQTTTEFYVPAIKQKVSPLEDTAS